MGALFKSGRGWYCRVAGKPRWVCPVATDKREAERLLAVKSMAWTVGSSPAKLVKSDHDRATVDELLNRWIVDRRADADRHELGAGAWWQYKLSAKRIAGIIGHHLADEVSPDLVRDVYARLTREHSIDFAKRAIGHLRQACNHAADAGWCRPVRLGRTAKLTTRPQASMKWRLYTPPEIQRILTRISRKLALARGRGDGRPVPALVQLRAMIYLALNGGFNAAECSELTRADVDLGGKFIRHRRGKTGALHVVPLWDETIAALLDAMSLRPDDPLLFRTREGQPWVMVKPIHGADGKLRKVVRTDNAHEHFRNLTRAMGLKIPGQSFGKLRHLFATTADKSRDRNAVSLLMGHALPGNRGNYIRVEDERLREVVELVRHELLIR